MLNGMEMVLLLFNVFQSDSWIKSLGGKMYKYSILYELKL